MTKTASTEVAIRNDFTPISQDAAQVFAEEMQGSQLEFITVTTPKAGGTFWTVEGEGEKKALEGVVVDDYEAHVLYLGDYNPSETKPPDGTWIAGECTYLSDEAKSAGFTPDSHKGRDDRLKNRQVLYLARPGQIVPLRIDLSGTSVRPWRNFKLGQIVNSGRRVTDAAISLELETVTYKSGFTGSVLKANLLGWLPAEAADGFFEQRKQLQPFTRTRTVPVEEAKEPEVWDLSGPLPDEAPID